MSNLWENPATAGAQPGVQVHDSPELEKSRLYKLKIDLLTTLQSAPPHGRENILERLEKTERRIRQL